jgi:hypothetical protein
MKIEIQDNIREVQAFSIEKIEKSTHSFSHSVLQDRVLQSHKHRERERERERGNEKAVHRQE